MKKFALFCGVVAALVLVIAAASFFLSGGATEGVGLVEVKGLIADSQETVRLLTECRKNSRIKAVVLRIDSPGGVVAPSQEISAEVKKLASVKKVVVSMGTLAASGGYYIAAPATTIFANPGTLTGSIGVIIKLPNVEGLMAKVGVKMETIATGPYKDSGSPTRPMNEADRAMIRGVIESSYGQFVRAVAEGRKLPVEEVKKIADGRILTGEQALQLHLVDRLGTLQDAIAEAGRLAGIKGEPEVIRLKKKRSFLLDWVVEETAGRIAERIRGEQEMSVSYQMGR
jgi:protease IV